MKNFLRCLATTVIGSIFATSFANAENIDTVPVEDQVSVRDLNHLGHALGVRSYLFDYESVEDHCLHFWLLIEQKGSESEIVDGRGICVLGGSYRLTVQLRRVDNDQLRPYFFVDERGSNQGTGLGAPKIDLEGNSVMNESLKYPSFSYGERADVVDVSYGRVIRNKKGDREVDSWKRVVVMAELRKNPHKIVGTE